MADLPQTYTREEWATGLLNALGNMAPSPSTVNFVVNWTIRENVNTQPGFNLLNTTLPEPGSKSVNSVGVQQYPTMAEGLQATAATLNQPNFAALKQQLQYNGLADNSYVDNELHQWSGNAYGFNSAWLQTPASNFLSQQEPGALQPPLVNNIAGNIMQGVIDLQNANDLLNNLASAWATLNNPAVWIRVGLFVLGLVLLIIGVIIFDTSDQKASAS